MRALPFVGRSTEVEVIRGLTMSGEGVAVIEAPAGTGKSRLVEEALHSSGVVVLSAAGDEDRLLEPGALVSRLVRGPSSTADELLDHLERAAADGSRLLLWIDDVQWCDERSARLLAAVVRRAEEVPVAMVLATRPTPRSRPVAELIGAASRVGSHLRLSRLDPSAVEELATALSLPVDSLAAASGHPFMLDHMARIGASRNEPSLVDDLPLSAAAHQLVSTCAALGDVFSLRDLARLEGRTTAQVQDLVREAIDLGVLTEVGASLGFSHDLWREAFAAQLPRPVAAALHREVATMRLNDGASPLEVAVHLKAGATTTDNELAGWLRQAAREAGRQDAGAAIELSRCAIAIAGPDLRASIEADLVTYLAWSNTAEGVRVGQELLASADDPRLRCRVHTSLALALSTAARNPEAAVEARRAIESGHCTPAQEANLLVVEALGSWVTDPAATRTAARAAEQRARELGETTAIISALVAQVRALDGLARFEEMRSVAQAALDLAATLEGDDAAPAGWRAWVLGASGDALMQCCDDDAALATLSQIVQASRKAQSIANEADALGVLILLHIRHGRWEEAFAEVAAWELLASEHPVAARGMASVPRRAEALHASIHAALDDAEAPDAVARWKAVAEGDFELARTFVPEGRLAFARGDLQAAAAAFAQAIEHIGRVHAAPTSEMRLRAVFDPIDAAEAACALAATGADDLALLTRRYSERVARLNPSVPVYSASGSFAASATGSDEEDLLAVAARVAAPGWRQRLLRVAGVILERRGERQLAASAAEMSGALRRELTLGARRQPPLHRTGWDALTAAESRVVELVAKGMTNGEVASELFLSRYTVETHLKRIFRKLGVRNRAELAAAAPARRHSSDT